MKNHNCRLFSFVLAAAGSAVPAFAQQTPAAPGVNEIFDRAKSATVVILAGEGGGRLRSVATGVVVSKDGVMFTALHAIKGALEVQVRTANGEVFDRVQRLGLDERRDVVALRIPANGLSTLNPVASSAPSQGDRVYAVTNAGGLTWSATEGIISAVRMADEVPGAGSGFRILQFTAPVAPGSSGGALVDSSGGLIGIITGSAGGAAFAVPIDTVFGLPNTGSPVALGPGTALQMPAQTAAAIPQSSAGIADSDAQQILRSAKTVFIHSKTMFLTVDTLDRALMNDKDWTKLGLTIVQDQRVADLLITLDRPLFTYIHTFTISDKRTSIVLGAGKVTAFDGTIASGGLAKDIIRILESAHTPAPATPAK